MRLFIIAIVLFATLNIAAVGDERIGVAEHERISANLSLGKAFKQYQLLMNEDHRFQAKPYAERVYSLAKQESKADPKRLKTFAASAYNLGRLHISVGTLKESQKYLKEALAAFKELHGKNSLELLDVLMDLGIATSYETNKYWSRQYFNQAVEIAIANSSENSPVVAQLYYEIAGHASVFGEEKTVIQLRKAQEIFAKEFGANHARTALASNRLGLTLQIQRKYEEAVPFMETAAAVFDQQAPIELYTIGAHSALISLYERLGQSEKATKHCQAVGKIKEARAEALPTGFAFKPLHTTQIKYPRRANQRGIQGFAILELTVDTEGRTKDYRVLQWTGSKDFSKAAIQAAKKFRYAVRFEDGEPVESQGVRYKFTFELIN